MLDLMGDLQQKALIVEHSKGKKKKKKCNQTNTSTFSSSSPQRPATVCFIDVGYYINYGVLY